MGSETPTLEPRDYPPPWPVQKPYDPMTELISTIKSVLWCSGFIAFLAIMVLGFIIVMAMTPEIQQWITTPFPHPDNPGQEVYPATPIFIITPWYVELFTLSGMGFRIWHMFILAMIVCSFALAKHDMFRSWLKTKEGAIKSLTNPDKATSSLEGVAKLFMAGISFSMFYFILIGIIGAQMDTPDFESMSRPALIYGLFNASVYEEIVSRVLLMGVPLVAIGIAKGWKKPLKGFLGGGQDLTPITFGLIVFSSVIFAFAHVGSWNMWKVPQVLITGMALGWAFVRYGLHASILIHFTINLSSSALSVWPENAIVYGILTIAILIWMAAGAYFLVHYAIELTMKLFPSTRPKPAAAAPAYAYPSQWNYAPPQAPYYPQPQYPPQWQNYPQAHMPENPPPPPPHWQGRPTVPPPPWAYRDPVQPPAQPPPPPPTKNENSSGGFVCSKCGGIDASYDSGKLVCLKCGAAHYRNGAPASAPDKVQIEF